MGSGFDSLWAHHHPGSSRGFYFRFGLATKNTLAALELRSQQGKYTKAQGVTFPVIYATVTGECIDNIFVPK
nr:hypothetical protein CJ188_01250 [Actinomyces sp. UMB0918]